MPEVKTNDTKLAGVSDTEGRAAGLKATKSTVTVHADGAASRLASVADGGGRGHARKGVEAGRRSGATMTVKVDGEKKTINVANKTEMEAALDEMGVSEADKKKVMAAAKRSAVKTKGLAVVGAAAAPLAAAQKVNQAKVIAAEAKKRISFSDYDDAADAGDFAGERIVGDAKKGGRKLASKATEKPRREVKAAVRRKLTGARTRIRSSATTQREVKAAGQAGKTAAVAVQKTQAIANRAARTAAAAKKAAAGAKGAAAAAANPYGAAVVAGIVLCILLFVILFSMFTAITGGGAEEEEKKAASLATGQTFLNACIAEVEEGEHPGGDKYWQFMGATSHIPWCASFMSYCADKAGLTEGDPLPKAAGVQAWLENTKGTRHWARDFMSGKETYQPKGGDIIIWYNGCGGSPVTNIQHVGVVEYIDDAGVLHTIEGNTSNRSMRRTHGTLADGRYDVIIEPEWPQSAGDGSLITDFSESEESFVEGWGAAIDRMYSEYAGGSAPLSGYGRTMARCAYKYKIDPRLCAAISIQESSGGNHCIKAYNAWGWMAYNDNLGAAASWSSWEEAIEGWHKGMTNSPALWPSSSLHELAQSYCSPPDEWEVAVGQMMGKITR